MSYYNHFIWLIALISSLIFCFNFFSLAICFLLFHRSIYFLLLKNVSLAVMNNISNIENWLHRLTKGRGQSTLIVGSTLNEMHLEISFRYTDTHTRYNCYRRLKSTFRYFVSNFDLLSSLFWPQHLNKIDAVLSYFIWNIYYILTNP